jgi:hypothetical protein
MEITEVVTNFDKRLKVVFNQRVIVMKHIYKEEYIITSLINDLIEQEQMLLVDLLFQKCINETKKEKAAKGLNLAKFNSEYELINVKRENVYQEERALEKVFKKEFANVGEYLDIISKLFKSRYI